MMVSTNSLTSSARQCRRLQLSLPRCSISSNSPQPLSEIVSKRRKTRAERRRRLKVCETTGETDELFARVRCTACPNEFLVA